MRIWVNWKYNSKRGIIEAGFFLFIFTVTAVPVSDPFANGTQNIGSYIGMPEFGTAHLEYIKYKCWLDFSVSSIRSSHHIDIVEISHFRTQIGVCPLGKWINLMNFQLMCSRCDDVECIMPMFRNSLINKQSLVFTHQHRFLAFCQPPHIFTSD